MQQENSKNRNGLELEPTSQKVTNEPRPHQLETKEENEEFVTQVVERFLVEQSFRGPIPPAEELKKYRQVEKTAPDRIIRMAEMQQEASIKNKEYALKMNAIITIIGQIFGFLIAVLFIGGGFYLINNGQSFEGFATVLGTGFAIIGLFIKGNKQDSSSQNDKQD